MTLLYVALGGALGAVLRFLTVTGFARAFGPAFPWGTFTVNVLGSFLMGIAAVLLLSRSGGSSGVAFAMIGVLGGFTTFSAFSLDVVRLMQEGQVVLSAVYAGGSVVLSVVALLCGMMLARGIA